MAVVPEGIASNAGALLPGILAALQDRSANTGLKIQALQLLRLAMAAAPAAAYQPHLPRLAPGVIGCAQVRGRGKSFCGLERRFGSFLARNPPVSAAHSHSS